MTWIETVIASLNFRDNEFDEFIETVTFYVMNRLRHHREEQQVSDDIPQWLRSTVELMHDKGQFSENALENMVSLSGKSQEYLTRATQRYYRKTPVQIINEIRINFAKNSWKLPTTLSPILLMSPVTVAPACLLKPLRNLPHSHQTVTGRI